MAVEIERLVAVLDANVNRFTKAMDKASGHAGQSFTKIERRGKAMEARLAGLGRGLNIGRGLFAAAAGSSALAGAERLIEASTRITNALKLTGLAGEDLTRTQEGLFAAAQKHAAPVEMLAQLYSRLSLTQKELGVSSAEILGFTENVALALRAGGQSAGEASGALLQLSQAMGSGTVRAEEFNSILEGAPAIAQAAAAGLEEAGGSVARLRQLVLDGKVSSEAFFRAFEAGAPMLAERTAGMSETVAQAMTRLQNSLIEAAGKFDAIVDASGSAAEALGWLAGVVEGLSNVFAAAADSGVGYYIGKLGELNDAIGNVMMPGLQLGKVLNKTGLDQIAGQISGGAAKTTEKTGRVSQAQIADRIGGAFGDPVKAPLKTVSLNDFIKTSSAAGGGGGSKRGGRGGGGSRENDYQRETEQVRARLDALNAEAAALEGLNPLAADYAMQTEKARIASELLTAAKKSGIAITPELKAQIDALAEGYAQAADKADKLADEQDAIRDNAKEFAAFGKDMLSGFISDLRAGKSGAEALAGALDKVADKLIDMALNALFSDGSGGLGGLLGSLLGFSKGGMVKGYASGGYTGAGGRTKPAGVVHAGEYVINARATRQIGRAGLDALNSGYANGGLVTPGMLSSGSGISRAAPQNVHVTVGVAADNNGNLLPFVQSVASRTAAGAVGAAAPGLVKASVAATQTAARSRPGFFR